MRRNEIEIGERAAGAGKLPTANAAARGTPSTCSRIAIAADAADRDRVVAETRGVTAHGGRAREPQRRAGRAPARPRAASRR